MIDVIKKTLLAGVGAAVITKDKVEAALSELVRQGKISTNEARDMAQKIADEGRREFETVSHDLGEKIRDRLGGAERRLQERIDALEARVAALEQISAAAAAPKVTASSSDNPPAV